MRVELRITLWYGDADAKIRCTSRTRYVHWNTPLYGPNALARALGGPCLRSAKRPGPQAGPATAYIRLSSYMLHIARAVQQTASRQHQVQQAMPQPKAGQVYLATSRVVPSFTRAMPLDTLRNPHKTRAETKWAWSV